ncbi:MAG: PIN domain-containing protein [Gemmatimonadetes bacterium]|nr:PIN domain-containing protein [Gemmatimonadota bacterium]
MERLSPRVDVEGFFAHLATAPSRVLLLDYDGTLAPFRVERDHAVPYPEARAALAAAGRSGRIDQAGLRTAVRDLEAACTAMALVGVDWALAQHAGEIAELYALRGYDAVHLATALSVDEPDLVLLTWDRDLADAAVRAGRAVIPA